MTPQGQIRVDANLEGPRPELVEAPRLRAAVGAQGHPRQHGATPEAQGLPRLVRCANVVALSGRLGGLAHELLKHLRVEDRAPESDPVPRSPPIERDTVRREYSP